MTKINAVQIRPNAKGIMLRQGNAADFVCLVDSLLKYDTLSGGDPRKITSIGVVGT